jgi:hypothetical protein
MRRHVLVGLQRRQSNSNSKSKTMININLFDHYSIRARLQPALVALLPSAIAVFAWTGPGVKWQSALWTLLGTGGGTYFLAILARNAGKRM